jgi:capsular polysaccharide biosynthesis protein
MSPLPDPVAQIRKLAGTLRRGRAVIVAASVVLALAAVLWSVWAPKTWTAATRLVLTPTLIEPSESVGQGARSPVPEPQFSVDTQAEILRSPTVAVRVANALGLRTSPDRLVAQVRADVVTGDVLEISASASDPKLAVALANRFTSEYLRYRRQQEVRLKLDRAKQLEADQVALRNRVRQVEQRIATSSALAASRTTDPVKRDGLVQQVEELRWQRRQLLSDAGAQSALIDELRISGAAPAVGDVIEPARRATLTTPLQAKLAAAVGVLLGLVLGAGIAWIRDRMHQPVGTRKEAAEVAGASVLASIPRRRRRSRRRATRDRADAAILDAYRALRLRLTTMGLGTRIRRVLVVAATAETDAHETVDGLAAACTDAGLATIVVTAGSGPLEALGPAGRPHDATRPHGLLPGQTQLEDELLEVGPNLRMLRTGRLGLGGRSVDPERFAKLLSEAENLANVLIIEPPPLLTDGEAAFLAGQSDAALLVVRADVSRADAVRWTVQSLSEVETPLLGVVVEAVHPRDDSTGFLRDGARDRWLAEPNEQLETSDGETQDGMPDSVDARRLGAGKRA